MNEVAHAIDYVLEHLEKKSSTPGDIYKFLTIVFYAQTTLVECYTKIVKLDKANKVSTNTFKLIFQWKILKLIERFSITFENSEIMLSR